MYIKTRASTGFGSGAGYLHLTPWGDLYPCHQFVGEDRFLMGNVDEGITPAGDLREFKGCNVYAKRNAGLFCKVLLQRRLCGEFVQFHGQDR